MELMVEWGNIDRLFAAMNDVGDQAFEVDTYFNSSVCSQAGFDYPTCALQALGDAMPVVGGYFTDMRTTFDGRWAGLIEAVASHAKDIEAADDGISHFFTQFRGSYPPQGGPPPFPAEDLAIFDIKEVKDHLVAPEEGDPKLDHSTKFTTVVNGWEAAAKAINVGVDILRDLGADVKHLDEDLRAYIVYPLAGDYGAIRANANACAIVDTAMTEWGMNFAKLAGNTELALKGEGALGFVGQLGLYGAVSAVIGAAIGRGRVVFDGIALMSEEIALAVEKVLVVLGERLIKLAARVGAKFVPGAGMASLAWDFATGKLDEMINDIKNTWDLIKSCLDIVDEVTAWAKEQSEKLKKFQEVLDAIDKLPLVSGNDTLASIGSGLDEITSSLDDVVSFGETVNTREAAVDDALQGLQDLADE